MIIACLFFTCTCLAQSSFEGTIKYSMKMEITDPVAKKRMEEAQTKLNDPATQAKMKEMEKQMNDPQMKAMMDANPQMKAQMESMMKMSQSGDMSSMMPKGMTIEVKNQNTLTKIEGGMAATEILYLKDKNQSVNLNRANKTYTILSSAAPTPTTTTAPKAKVTKTSETTKILNYTATKYIVEMMEGGKTMTNAVWATTEIKDLNLSSMSGQRLGNGGQMSLEGVDGVPLKMEMSTPEMKMTMEATEIKKQSVPASDFVIPSDYKEVKGMAGMMNK